MNEQACRHSHIVRDYLTMRGEQYGVGPKPHTDRCDTCHGPATDAEVEDRERWTHRLLLAIDRSKTGALIDKERDILNGMTLRFGREPRP